MKSSLSAILVALLSSLAPHNVEADVTDVIWTGGVFSDYSAASNWSPQVVPNNGNDANTYRATIDNGGPILDIDASVDAYNPTGRSLRNFRSFFSFGFYAQRYFTLRPVEGRSAFDGRRHQGVR